ncbi:MAG: hypothetical protein IT534_08340 [Bauldia sp.]|nr:hypothetical protein [Bauldia sp.]
MSRTTSPSEHDYAAIEAAVMETERGRWFLAEHAARHRVADTATILAAIGRMEAATPAPPPQLDGGLRDIGAILGAARAAARGNAADANPPHLRPMQIADGAITAVRRVAEKIHEVAFELRENASRSPMYAEALDLYCRDLDSASSLQEKAILQLAELAGVVEAIEAKLATLAATLPARPVAEAPAAPLPAVRPLPSITPVPSMPPPAADAGPVAPAEATAVMAVDTAPPAIAAATAPAREPPRRTLLLVQPIGPKR